MPKPILFVFILVTVVVTFAAAGIAFKFVMKQTKGTKRELPAVLGYIGGCMAVLAYLANGETSTVHTYVSYAVYSLAYLIVIPVWYKWLPDGDLKAKP